MNERKVAIDFGTCYIKVSSFIEKTKKVVELKLSKDEKSTNKKVDNIITYKTREDFLIGKTNRNNSETMSSKLPIKFVKRKLELEEYIYDLGEFKISAYDVTCDIFSFIKRCIEGLGHDISGAIITVPVCFSQVQVKRIESACISAGIKVDRIEVEPVAALFSIEELFEEDEAEETIVVFDFGGATLDLCLFTLENDGEDIEISIEATSGIDFGGIDITKMILEDIILPKYDTYIKQEIEDFKGDILEKKIHDLLMLDFSKITNELKEELFIDEDEEEVSSLYSGRHGSTLNIELTMDEVCECFENNNVREKIVQAIDYLFEENESIEKTDVTKIKTFGGTSCIKYIRDILEEYFDLEVEDFEADEAYSGIANGGIKLLSILQDEDSNVTINNSIGYYIGIENNGDFEPIINRNQKYSVFTPWQKLELFANSDMKIKLYQSFYENNQISEENGAVYMGEISLDIEKNPELLCKFGIDDYGICKTLIAKLDEKNEIVIICDKEIDIGG